MLRVSITAVFVFVCLQLGAGAAVPPLDLKISRETRLLVVAAHPDDETIAAGGLIRRVTAAGGDVRIVILTSGDAFYAGLRAIDPEPRPTAGDYREYGEQRERETLAAMATLGVAADHVTFLGFPDEGLCLLASKYLTARAAYESPYTERMTPPDDEQIVRGVRYRGIDLRRELERVVVSYEPTLVAIPHPEDEHPDHCATHIFARDAVRVDALRHPPGARVLHYLVHYGRWPSTANTDVRNVLDPPAGFPPPEGHWVSLRLGTGEAAVKRRALAAYHTQMAVIGPFLLAFGGSNELFLEGEPASLPECWCNGENVATELPPEKRRRRPASHP